VLPEKILRLILHGKSHALIQTSCHKPGHPSNWEAETEGTRVLGQPGLQRETSSNTIKQKQTKARKKLN
jgi:hypothetical protein